MTSRRIAQSALAAITKRKLPSVTSKVSISSMVKMQCSSHPQTVYVHDQYTNEEQDHGRAEVFRTAISHPLQDYVPASDASNFLVTWPAQNDHDTLTARMLHTLEGIRQSTSIQVTQPFIVLDGRGDKMASMCIVPTTSRSQDDYFSTSGHDWPASGPWMEYNLSLNQ